MGGCAPPSVLTPQKLKEQSESEGGGTKGGGCSLVRCAHPGSQGREQTGTQGGACSSGDDPEAPLPLSRSCGIQASCSPRPHPPLRTQFPPPTAGRDSKRSSAAASYPPIRCGCYYSCVRVPDRQHVDRPCRGSRGLAPAAALSGCALLSHIPGPRARGSYTEIALVLGERHGLAGLPRACDRRAPARDAAVRAGLLAPGVRVTVQSQRHRYVRAVQLVPAPGQAAQPADAGPRHAARPRACSPRARVRYLAAPAQLCARQGGPAGSLRG